MRSFAYFSALSLLVAVAHGRCGQDHSSSSSEEEKNVTRTWSDVWQCLSDIDAQCMEKYPNTTKEERGCYLNSTVQAAFKDGEEHLASCAANELSTGEICVHAAKRHHPHHRHHKHGHCHHHKKHHHGHKHHHHHHHHHHGDDSNLQSNSVSEEKHSSSESKSASSSASKSTSSSEEKHHHCEHHRSEYSQCHMRKMFKCWEGCKQLRHHHEEWKLRKCAKSAFRPAFKVLMGCRHAKIEQHEEKASGEQQTSASVEQQ